MASPSIPGTTSSAVAAANGADSSTQVAFVAGASRGIGAAVASGLRAAGWRVLTCSRTPADNGHDPDWVAADLSTEVGITAASEFLTTSTNRLDALVLCAGTLFVDKTPRITAAKTLDALRINVGPLVGLAPAAIRLMAPQGHGRIVVVGSVGAYRVSAGNGRYAASKAALEAVVRTAARELGPIGITVNLVAPGFTDTAMLSRGSAVWRAERIAEIPRARWAEPAEVARPLIALLDPRASYINGATVMIDGGYAMGR